MDKFKELQEQHQQSPKEANPFLERERGIIITNVGSENEPNSETTEQSIDPRDGMFEPEVIDNQVKPDTAPTDHEGEE